jgi:hypothetical protein
MSFKASKAKKGAFNGVSRRVHKGAGVIKSERIFVAGIAGYQMRSFTVGSSSAASAVDGVHRMLDRDLPSSVLFDSLTNSILDVCNEASSDNWDGYKGRAVSPKTCGSAVQLAKALPINLPTPDVAAEPQGGVAFEWRYSKDEVFTIIARDELFLYAGLYGKNKVHGVELLSDGVNLKPILDGLRRLYAGI